MRRTFLVVLAAVVISATSARADLVLSGTTSVSAQGFGNINVVLTLHDKGTETGAIAPTNAVTTGSAYTTFGGTAITSYGTCGSGGPPVNFAISCGSIANTSTIRDLSALGLSSASQFAVLLNISQDVNRYLTANAQNNVIFEVNLYDANGNVVASFPCLATTCGYPAGGLAPVGNGQGQAGYLFTLTSAEQQELNLILCGATSCSSSTLAAGTVFVGAGGSFSNANGGQDDISIARMNGVTTTPEPASFALLGSGLVGLAGLLRRRKCK